MKLNIIKQVLKDGLRAFRIYFFGSRRDHYGYIHESAKVYQPSIGNKKNVYLYENTVIHEGCKFITQAGKFIMKRNSTASFDLTVITFNHLMDLTSLPNMQSVNISNPEKRRNGYSTLIADEVIIEEGCLLGANVTLLPGTHILRGSIVGANSVCTRSHKFPPYAIIVGNPAKFIKFRFSFEEQVEYENIYFKDDERIPIETLKTLYTKYSSIQ